MNKFRNVIRALRPLPFLGFFARLLTTCYGALLWHRQAREGHRYVKQAYGGKFRHSKPLKIKNLKIFELQPSPKPGLFQFNPTILCDSDRLKVIWRISNWHDDPFVTFFGKRRNPVRLTTGFLMNQVGNGHVSIAQGEISQRIEDEELILGLEQDALPAEALNQWDTDGYLNGYSYEDPRTFPGNPTILTLTAVQQGRRQGRFITNATISLYDFVREKVVLLVIPGLEAREKNWVLADVTNDRVTFLRQSEPPRLVEVDRKSGHLVSESVGKPTGRKFLHGGSSFVLVDGSFYLRVARQRISLRGVRRFHINHIVKHDLDFKEIYRSQPFVFRDYGFEICNGLDYNGTHFYFAWGENDCKMFAASIEKNDLLTWLSAHEEEQITTS